MSGKLDLSSLEKALGSLDRAIRRSSGAPGDEELRDAVIQRFEYTYELCWKTLKRLLEREAPTPAEIDMLSFRQLIREGGERGIVRDVEKWMVFREKRNISSHTYDREKAEEVYKAALEFYPEALALFEEVRKRNHG